MTDTTTTDSTITRSDGAVVSTDTTPSATPDDTTRWVWKQPGTAGYTRIKFSPNRARAIAWLLNSTRDI